MKGTYLSRDFRETAAQCFPSQAKELNAFFDTRLNVLLAENADASKEKQYHLQRQILPGIAAYETLQRVMPKEEALQIVHGYVERLARTSHKQLATLLLIPGLYRLVPGVFVKSTRSVFGPAAGFDSKELQVGNGIWRVDMMKCPYHDTCVAYGCPELCCCFCDSDDISYTGLHPKLIWHRTKTLGRGDDRCDFCMKIMQTSVYKGYKQDKIEMRGDRAEMSDFPLYLNTVAGGLDRRDQTIGGFSFVVKIYAVPVVEIIG